MTNGIDLNKIDLGSFGINEEDQQQNQLNANMTEAVKVNPDQHARVTQLSKQSGVPEFAVESNPEEIEQKLKLDQIDLEGLKSRAPGTANFIGRDFNNAVIAQEDVVDGVMESIETIFSGLGESIKLGFKQQASGLILGGLESSSDSIYDIVPASAMPIGMEMEAQRLSLEYAELLGVETDEEYAALKQEGADLLIDEIQKLEKRRQEITPKDMTIVEEGVRSGLESLANMVPATLAMIGTRGRAAPLMIIGAQTYTGSYADARGKGLPIDEARWFASIDAAIEVGTEVLPLGTLERIMTGQSRGLKKEAIQFAVREMGTEQLATALQSLNSFSFGLDEEMENAQTVEEMAEIQLRRQAVTAIATVVTGGLQATGATVVNRTVEKLSGTERQQEVQGQVEQRSIDQLNAQAERSKLKERDVESFKQFIREADGENDTHVFIDSVQTALYMQEKTRGEIEADPALKTLDNALRESRTTGADVSVPVADFTGDIAGTEHFNQLREHMTLSDQAVSPFRQEQHRQETQDYVRTLLDEANENVSEFVEAQEIYTSVRDQLIDTGAVNAQNASIMAQVVPAWATAQARRTGRSVQQVYADAGLTIEGPQTGEIQRLSEEALRQNVEDFTGDYPLADFDSWWGDRTFREQGGQFVEMTPDEYLSQVAPLDLQSEETQENVQDLVDHIESGRDLDPLVIFADGKEDGRHRALAAKQLGYTTVPVIDYRQPEADQLAQAPVEDRNLVVTHNLSAENILAAADLGGLAAPSIATIRTDVSDFDQFGEVSLLADPSLLESAKARTFDADVYSPRQPRATYDIDSNKFAELYNQLDPDRLGLSRPDIQSLEDGSGAENLQRSTAVQYLWLQQQGKAPKQKQKKVDAVIKKAQKLMQSEGIRDHFDLSKNEKFQKMAKQHYDKMLEKVAAADEGRVERYRDFWFDEDGNVLPRKIIDLAHEVDRFNREGGVDVSQLRQDIDKKFRVKKTRDEYDQWVTDQFNDMVKGKKLFKGFTPSGNRRYVDYNMQNVVKEMTQQLQGGEASFYGAGSIRSTYANELKTVKKVQQNRDKIVSEEAMNQIKEDSSQVLEEVLDKLKPFYKFDADSWGYADDAGRAMMEGPKGLREAFEDTPEVREIVTDFTEYLAALPSSYFETKIQRPVEFSEFNTAVVPRGMRKDAVQALRDAGLKIKTYDPSGKGKTRQQVIAEQQKLLFQRTETNGEPEARGYYDPANSIIRLTEAADLSTFLHEFAHFMYEMEVNNNTEMVQSINNWYKRNSLDVALEATEYLGEEFDVLKQDGTKKTGGKVTGAEVIKYLDEGTTGVKAKDAAIRRAVHEQFARGFETYLMEGKSPSIELRNAFRAFARWLSQIYQRLRGNLDVNLDNEMRQVFDRLLATEEQIAAAEARARVEPFFTDAAMAGMTEEQFADYQKRQEKVKDVQSETLRDKLIKQLTRQTQAWWKEEKQDLIDEEMGKLRGEQVYTTAARLKDGDIKLDHATVKEMIGEERTDKLGRKSIRIPDELRGMTAKGQAGVHPDEAAAFFGYNSGSEMLTDLVTAPKIETVAESNAERRMIDAHGDILTDGTIEQQADEAVQSEERGRLILHELKMVARGTNQRSIERETMKTIAAERIGQLSFREIHPGKYRKAEIRAAQEAARMLAEGNREGAAQAKQRQAVNYYMGLEATNAKNEITKIVDRMARYNKKKVREEIQKAEGGYWDQIVKILERFEFRKSATLTAVDQVNQDINTWAKERIEIDGDGLVLHNAVLNESYVTHWKNVAYSDMQGINDSVKNIEHVARYANKLTRMGEEIEFNKLVDRWTTSMDEKVKTRFKSKRTDVVEGKKWGRWLMAQMSKIPFMASWLDGGERVGISHQVLVQPMTDAYAAEINLWKDVATPVMEAIENRSKEDRRRHNRKIFIPEINDHLYGHQVIAVALNTGNQSNLRKLLLGEQWANPENETDIAFDNAKLQAVLRHMTANDWQMVQLIWDQMEQLYPQLSEVHRRTTGLVPPKVEATPIETAFGTFRGGYYPVKYDPNRSHRAAQNEDKLNAETESMFSNNASIQTSVNTGATNERTGFYDAIRLSLDVVPAHFQETIHYITHHDPVREVNRLIRDARVAQTIKEKLGPEEYAQLRPWLNDIAKDGREAPTKMFWDDMLQRLRFGVTLGAMGFKASTGIIQISGLSNTISEVGMNHTMQGVRAVLGSTTTMKQAWEFAKSNSKVMEHRAQTMDREIKNAMRKLEGKRGILPAVQEASMKHIALIQTYMVDLPSWHAAYTKGMTEWGDETRAFQYADFVVEQVQGSGATKDLARIMRNQTETGRMFTMFMTFFSSLWNMERDLVKGAKAGTYSTTTVAAKVMFLFTLPVLFEMLMRGEFSTDDDSDDDETLTQKMLTKTALYPIQSVPFVRDVANAVGGDFGYNISPMQQIMEQGVRTIPEVVERGFTDEEITGGQAKGATKFVGAALGIPGTGQAWATGEHLHEVLVEGEDFTLREFLFGPDR